MEKSAVEWFEVELESISVDFSDGLITFKEFIELYEKLLKQAKEMEAKQMYSKEEVIKAHALGMDYYAEPNDWDKVTPKQKLENLLNKEQ
jgi:hypothetical protein